MNTKSRRFWGCIESPGFTSQMQVYGQFSECWVKSYFSANKAESSSDWGAPQPQGVQLTTFHFEATNFSGADKTYLISKIFGFHICATSSRWEKIDILRTSPTSPLGIQSISQLKTASEELERYSAIAILNEHSSSFWKNIDVFEDISFSFCAACSVCSFYECNKILLWFFGCLALRLYHL